VQFQKCTVVTFFATFATFSPFKQTLAMARKRLTNGQKLSILNDCMARQAMGESLRSVAHSHGIQPVQIRKWKLKTNQLSSSKRRNKSLSRGNALPQKYDVNKVISSWLFPTTFLLAEIEGRNHLKTR